MFLQYTFSVYVKRSVALVCLDRCLSPGFFPLLTCGKEPHEEMYVYGPAGTVRVEYSVFFTLHFYIIKDASLPYPFVVSTYLDKVCPEKRNHPSPNNVMSKGIRCESVRGV